MSTGVCACGEEFNTYNKKKEGCSYSCARKKVWTNPDYVKNKISSLKNGWSKERRESWGNFQREYQSRPDIKASMSKIQKEVQNRDEVNKKRSNTLNLLWEDPDYLNKQQSISYKKIILPSGQYVNLQGYEPVVLMDLLVKYSEENIIMGVKNINNALGFITYIQDGKIHKYFPDFYIKSTNTIIEVKSEWTYKKQEIKNQLKRQACLDRGFNFEFAIFKSGQSKNNLQYEMCVSLPLFVPVPI